jgi:hypothetical protein
MPVGAPDPLPRLCQHHAGRLQAGGSAPHGSEVRLAFEVQQGIVAFGDGSALAHEADEEGFEIPPAVRNSYAPGTQAEFFFIENNSPVSANQVRQCDSNSAAAPCRASGRLV